MIGNPELWTKHAGKALKSVDFVQAADESDPNNPVVVISAIIFTFEDDAMLRIQCPYDFDSTVPALYTTEEGLRGDEGQLPIFNMN